MSLPGAQRTADPNPTGEAYVEHYVNGSQGSSPLFALADAPSGGDDSAMLAALLTGSRTVVLRPGAVYTYALDAALPAFSGRILGNGATIAFTYAGAYHGKTVITAWTDVVCEQVNFTAPGAQLFAIIGSNCAGLTFRDCRVFDCTPTFALPIARDFVFVDGRIDSSDAPPATIQQRIGIADSGRFVFENNVVDFAPHGAAGSIIGGTDGAPAAGTTVTIRGNTFFASNAAGHTIDGVIDIEPSGATPYELVEIADNDLWNATCYLASANRINVHHNRCRFTSVNGTRQATPWVVFNNNNPRPATGTVVLEDNEVLQDVSAIAQPSGVIKQTIAADELLTRHNRVTVNGASTAPEPYITLGATLNRLTLDDDEITQAGGTAQSVVALASFTGTPTGKVSISGGRLAGTWQHLLAFAGGAATVVDLLRVERVDVRDLTLSTGNRYDALTFNNGKAAITAAVIRGNPGLNPLPFTKDVAPALPASGATVTNTTGYDVTVYVSGGAVTTITVAGVVTGLTQGAIRLSAGQTIALTYTSAPAWHWVVD